MKTEFLRVAAVAPVVGLGDCMANATAIISSATRLASQGVKVALYPELSLTGYTLGDLFHDNNLLDACHEALEAVMHSSRELDMVVIVGLPWEHAGALYNCAAVIARGELLGIVPKIFLPNYGEFYEKRWFASGAGVDAVVSFNGCECRLTALQLFTMGDVAFGIEICEDLWTTIPPSSRLALKGAEVIFNLSASNDIIGKYNYLTGLVRQQSSRCTAAYVYASSGWGESTTDLVFDPKCIIAENGTILAASPRWQRREVEIIAEVDLVALRHDRRHLSSFADCARTVPDVDARVAVPVEPFTTDGKLLHEYSPTPFVPQAEDNRAERAAEVLNIQATALARRLMAAHAVKVVVGISGGLDSTLALLVAVRAFDMLELDRKGIIAITMPGFGTTGRTRSNAETLMETLGVTPLCIPIGEAVNQHFKDIHQDPAKRDVTYENSQARERTQILMDVANKENALVVGTGDLSELALGWATYNGDHMSMYGVNAGIPKTLVRHLVQSCADATSDPVEAATLRDIVDTPISPELIPADDKDNITQVTEDLVGPYELHDFFLYHTVRYGRSLDQILRLAARTFDGVYTPATIEHWLRTFNRRFFRQQFKRSCLPDGPKVGNICLSPRGDWRMPSDATPWPMK